jgi:hypothetical protein
MNFLRRLRVLRVHFPLLRPVARSLASCVTRIIALVLCHDNSLSGVSRTHAMRLRSTLLSSRRATQNGVFSPGRGSPAVSLRKRTRRSAHGSFCVHFIIMRSLASSHHAKLYCMTGSNSEISPALPFIHYRPLTIFLSSIFSWLSSSSKMTPRRPHPNRSPLSKGGMGSTTMGRAYAYMELCGTQRVTFVKGYGIPLYVYRTGVAPARQQTVKKKKRRTESREKEQEREREIMRRQGGV